VFGIALSTAGTDVVIRDGSEVAIHSGTTQAAMSSAQRNDAATLGLAGFRAHSALSQRALSLLSARLNATSI
jgi:hypothetical protein